MTTADDMFVFMQLYLISVAVTTVITTNTSIVFMVDGSIQTTYSSAWNYFLSEVNATAWDLNSNTDYAGLIVETRLLEGSFTTMAQTVWHTDRPSIYVSIIHCHQCIAQGDVLHLLGNATKGTICYHYQSDKWKTCSEYLLQMASYTHLVTELVHMDDTVAFIYDSTQESDLQQVISQLALKCKMLIYTYNSECVIQIRNSPCQFLPNISNSISKFIVTGKPALVEFFLKQRNEIDIVGPTYNILIDNRHDDETLKHITMKYMLGGNNILLVNTISESSTTGFVERIQKGEHLSHTSQHMDKNKPVLSIQKCYRKCNETTDLKTISIVKSSGAISNIDHVFQQDFQGFDGRHFDIVTKTYFPFVDLVKIKGKETYTGLVVEILDALTTKLNFSYTMYEVPDGQFGIVENGSWNGMIGVVHRKEADMAASGITISADRDTVVDFTTPYWEEPSGVLFKRSTNASAQLMRNLVWIFKPLRFELWLLILSAMVLVAVMMCMFARCNFYLCGYRDRMLSPLYCLLYTFSIAVQQNSPSDPMLAYGRLLGGIWLFVIIVLYATYTGNLIAFLSVTKIYLPFNTLREMTEQSEYKYGAEAGIIHLMLFKNAESGVYADIWKGITSNPEAIVQNSQKGFDKVSTDKYALIGDKTFLEANSVGDCDLAFIKEEFYKVGFGFAVQDGWPYKKYFDKGILKLVNGGFIDKWRKKHWPVDTCDVKLKYVQSKNIDLAPLFGVFFIFVFGVIVSISVFACEVWRGNVKLSPKR